MEKICKNCKYKRTSEELGKRCKYPDWMIALDLTFDHDVNSECSNFDSIQEDNKESK